MGLVLVNPSDQPSPHKILAGSIWPFFSPVQILYNVKKMPVGAKTCKFDEFYAGELTQFCDNLPRHKTACLAFLSFKIIITLHRAQKFGYIWDSRIFFDFLYV